MRRHRRRITLAQIASILLLTLMLIGVIRTVVGRQPLRHVQAPAAAISLQVARVEHGGDVLLPQHLPLNSVLR